MSQGPSAATARRDVSWSDGFWLPRRSRDAAYLLLGSVTTVSTAQSWWQRTLWVALAAAALSALLTVGLLLVRHRHPVALTVAGLPLLLLDPSSLYPLLIFSLALRRRYRALLGLAVLGPAVAGLAGLLQDRSVTENAVSEAVAVALSATIGSFIAARRELVTSLRERAEQAEATAVLRQEQARLAERTRIAREMHDVVAHRISLISLHAGALEVAGGDSPAVERTAAVISGTARQALTELREILGVLRADPSSGCDPAAEAARAAELAPQPTLADLPRLIEQSIAAGVPVTLDDPEQLVGFRPAAEATGRAIYRVVQEALTNVHKHAPDAATVVTLARQDDDLVVQVRNTRPASVTAAIPGSGTGLIGLRERVALAGGRLRAENLPDGGWLVRAVLPVRGTAE